jgi:hypothetical protein
MNTVGPAINFLTSCCPLPQKEQYNELLLSELPSLGGLLMGFSL